MDAIIQALTHIIVSIIGKKLQKTRPASEGNIECQIRLPAYYPWVGVICSALFSGLVILSIFINGSNVWYTAVIFGLCAVFGLFIIMVGVNWRIDMYGTGFTYRTIFGRQYDLRYSDVIEVERSETMITVITDKKKLYIDPHVAGVELFLQRLTIWPSF